MSPERLTISTSVNGASVLLELSGELDLASIDILKGALEGATSSDTNEIEVDLAGLTFIDSTGLGTFVDFHHECAGNECTLAFRSVPDHVVRLMEITRLNELLVIR